MYLRKFYQKKDTYILKKYTGGTLVCNLSYLYRSLYTQDNSWREFRPIHRLISITCKCYFFGCDFLVNRFDTR